MRLAPPGPAKALPRPLSRNKGGLLLREGGGEGRGEEGEREGRGRGRERKGKGEEGEGEREGKGMIFVIPILKCFRRPWSI